MLLPCGVSYTQTRCGLLGHLTAAPFADAAAVWRLLHPDALWTSLATTAAPFTDAAAFRRLLHPDALWTSLATDSNFICC